MVKRIALICFITITAYSVRFPQQRNYMTEMGGKIELDAATSSSGATFIIKLPLPDDVANNEKQVKSKVRL